MTGSLERLNRYAAQGIVDEKTVHLVQEFYHSYMNTCSPHIDPSHADRMFAQLIDLISEAIQHPFPFDIYHQRIKQPFDYYHFGLDFIRPLIDFGKSQLIGKENILLIEEQLKNKENVILLANHQIEPDPQIISLLLEKIAPELASEMIFIAGHRVIKDPMAIPMSMGRNLLCIYSKKHISNPPEAKTEKMLHNQRTMKKMSELLDEGGVCIYVAPSGGRDRPNAAGKMDVARFDPQSVELFWLMARHARNLTHFYPLALKTYDLMPPPSQVEKELGEKRMTHYTPVYVGFGNEINMKNFPGSESADKKSMRNVRCEYIWQQVHEIYHQFP